MGQKDRDRDPTGKLLVGIVRGCLKLLCIVFSHLKTVTQSLGEAPDGQKDRGLEGSRKRLNWPAKQRQKKGSEIKPWGAVECGKASMWSVEKGEVDDERSKENVVQAVGSYEH
jgi:hypothetical protein